MKDIHDPLVLAELDILFASDGVFDVHGDAGWNCYAKAFMSTWLLRLWGEASDSYEGRLCIVSPGSGKKEIIQVSPHAWSGTSEKRIVDLSIRNVGASRYLTVVGGHVAEDSSWTVYVEKDRSRFDRLCSGRFAGMPSRFLAYSPQRVRSFDATEIHNLNATFSPSAARTLAKYPENLLPKAVLHMFQFAEDQRRSLSAHPNSSAWDELHKWKVDAFPELISLLK